MMQVKNLTITHKKDLREIVADLSFVLNDGDKAALIGEEGNGKSTLIKLLCDPGLVEGYAEYSGEIIKNHVILGYLPQELSMEDGEKSVYEYLSDEPCFWDIDAGELAVLTREMGIPHELLYSEQRMGLLSGGEKVKIQFVRMLCRKPNLFLLDEPSNDIDIQTLEWLESFINACPFPILYISHDETLLERTANMILHMEQIKRKTTPRHTVARMPYEEYVKQRQASLERQEQQAVNERKEYDKQQERFRRIEQKVEYQQETITRQSPHVGQLLKKKMHVIKSQEKRFEKEFADMTKRPETEDAIFFDFSPDIHFPAGKTVLDFQLDQLAVGERVLARQIRLRIIGPRKVCIIGKNGVGKTTLLKLIAENLLHRTDIKAAYMPQNYEDLLDFEMTPVEYLAPSGHKDEITRVRTYLGSMKYTADEMGHPIRELSGGQKAKILLLKISMDGSNVLILDEPTRNFSPLSNPVIREMLSRYQGVIISISHDRKYIREVCDTIYELDSEGLHPLTTV